MSVGVKLEESVTYQLARIAAAAQTSTRKLLADAGLTPRTLAILVALERLGTVSQATLAKALALNPSSLVGLLDQLEDSKFVGRHRDPNDRRVQNVDLLNPGKTFLVRVAKAAQKDDERFLASLNSAEAASFTQSLTTIGEHLRARPV